ncbi:cation channel family protein (macronuclear) [Tetrahymena thermophila SB210]|uniref:Cation channel family protein n=1 Tax=Tetrahymena thermophila (strain SB210) TaxID=312017 RepID=Q240K8_TETTS|nr:cation channel family protein [Tetrahymena thermophila SB210]EAS02200.2 cation channel family protein [Tetrahymena thermophila SB210]|eukprot:XP_001022445.2 cation channel family protein [Tetrahymena thermophila SB210]
MENPGSTEHKLVTIHTEVQEGNNMIKKNQQKGAQSLLQIEESHNMKSDLMMLDDKSVMKQSHHSILSHQNQNLQIQNNQLIKRAVSNKSINFQDQKQNEILKAQNSGFPHDFNQNEQELNLVNDPFKINQNDQKIITENFVTKFTNELKHQTSNQREQIKISINLSIIVKLIKAVKVFKSFLIPQKIPSKQARIIYDLSYYDIQQKHHSKKKNNSLKNAYKKFILYSQKQNKISVFYNKAKEEVSQFTQKFFKFLDENFPVIYTFNPLKVIFDIFKILVTIFAIFINTVEVCFDLNFSELYPDVLPKIRYSIITFYAICMFLSLNTSIYHKGLTEQKRLKIFKIYVSKRFISDALSIISFVTFDSIQRVFRDLIKLFILAQIQVASQKLQNFQDFSHTMYNKKLFYVVRLVKLLLVIIFVAHFVAICFYGQTLIFEFSNDPNWVNSSNLINTRDVWYIKYIFALYFSVTTMMTVGYGDITPKNVYEASLCIICMFISCGVFAYSFNLIGLIIQDMNKKERYFKKKINKVNLYLQDRNIDDELKNQVQKFYEYKFKHSKILTKADEEQILQEISPYLLEKIIFQTKQKILNSEKKIFARFSEQFRNELCLKLKEVHVNKDEILFEEGSKSDDPQLYFIHRGHIEIYYKNKYNLEGITLKCLSNGQIFGENSFLLNTEKSASAKAAESSILYTLSRSDFLDQLSHFTAEKEKFHFIINNLQFRQSNTIISQQCYCCHSEKHNIKRCPKLHYQPDRDLVILKENFSKPQRKRREFRRKRRKESGYSVLIISKQYQLEEPIGIQKENLEFPENKETEKETLLSETSADQESSGSKSEHKEPIKTLASLKTFMQDKSPHKLKAAKPAETFSHFPKDDEEIYRIQSQQSQAKTMQFDQFKDYQSTNNILIKSIAAEQSSTLRPRNILRYQQQYAHQNQYRQAINIDKQNEEDQKARVKAKEQFIIPKMSFNDEVLNTSDITQGEFDEQRYSPINHLPKSMPSSRNQSIFQRPLPNLSKENSSKDFHYSSTIRDLVKFKEKFQQNHQKLASISMNVSCKMQRKSILKSNTTKPNNDQFQIILKSTDQQKQNEMLSSENIDISDKMKSFKYFYPNFNYQKIIQHYNMLSSIQNCKLPHYFNVYSFYNRKDKNLRNMAVKIQKSKLKLL